MYYVPIFKAQLKPGLKTFHGVPSEFLLNMMMCMSEF